MKKSALSVALVIALAATGAAAKDKPQPKMKSETITTLSTQNAAGGQEWLPFLMMMLVLIGIISKGSGYMMNT